MRLICKTFPILAMLLIGTMCGCGARKPHYLALGDSYTIGESVSESARWPVQLAAALKRDGIDLGEPLIIAQSGWTTGDLSAAMDRENPHGPFDLVTLLIGVNNQYQNRDAEEFRREFVSLLKRSIALAGDRPSHVLVLSIPDWSVTPFAPETARAAIATAVDHFNDIVRVESKSLAVRYVNITPETRCAATQPTFLADDGLHPSALMYSQWVKAALPEAESALK